MVHWLARLTIILALLGAATTRAAEPIRVTAVLPFSGGVELFGQQAKLGLDLAAADINATGGILGRPLQVTYRDDGTRPNIAAEAARKAIEEDQAFAVVGPITSANLDAIVPLLAASRIPLLYATNYEGGICNRYMFAFSSVPNQELDALLPYMTRTFGRDYFLLGADRVWPHRMFDAAAPVLQRIGATVVDTQYTLGSAPEIAALLDKVAARKPQVLLYALKGDGSQFMPLAAQRGVLKSTAVAFLGLTETDLAAFNPPVDDLYAAVPFVATGADPKVRAFVARARALAPAGTPISSYVETHYNSLIALKAAIEKAGKVDREAAIDALEGLRIDTPGGALTMGRDHHATLDMVLAKSKGADLVPVETLGAIAPQSGCMPGGLAR